MYIYRSFYYRRRRRTRVNRQMDVFVCFASLEQARARSPTISTILYGSRRRFLYLQCRNKKLPL